MTCENVWRAKSRSTKDHDIIHGYEKAWGGFILLRNAVEDLRGEWLVILGLGLILLTKASLRFSGMEGIYPIDVSLSLRHALSVLVLFLIPVVIRFGNIELSQNLMRWCGVVLAMILSGCFILSFFLSSSYADIALVAEVMKEALIVLFVVLWAAFILPLGFRKAIMVFGAAAICEGILQLATCWLQYSAHLFVIATAPLLSAGLLFVVKNTLAAEENNDEKAAFVSSTNTARVVQMTIFVTIFCLMFVIGQVVFMALELQQALSVSVLAEVCMGLGNVLGGGCLVFFARYFADPSYLFAVLMLTAAFVAIAFYSSIFTTGFLTGFFLTISSWAIQITGVLPILYVFIFGASNASVHNVATKQIARYALASVFIYLAQTVSSLSMIAHLTTESSAYYIAIAFMLVVLVLCCMFLMLRMQNKQAVLKSAGSLLHATSNSLLMSETSSDLLTFDAAQHPRPFQQVMAEMSEEFMLTPQEGNVLAQLAQGLNARSISEAMVLSSNTVRSHMRNVYAKVGVHSQQELISLVNKRVEIAKDSFLTQAG